MTHGVLITGGARRIGRAMALHLAAQGYHVLVHYGHSEADARATQALAAQKGGRISLLQADLSDQAAVAGLMAQAIEREPSLMGLIHNASIFEPASFHDADEASFDRHMQLHVKAPFFLSQAFAAQVSSGVIITMLDTFITKHTTRYFPYLLSKKALAEMTQMLAKTLAPNIRVNAIAPGLTLPSGEGLGEEAMAERAQRVPLGALGTPEEIAHAAQYLLEATYLTGHTLFIDGGEQLG